jgi:hypothetical protein
MRCEIRRLEKEFPRNFIYFKGNIFHVSLLSVSSSSVAIFDKLLLPRLLLRISGASASSSFAPLSSVQFIVFEFENGPGFEGNSVETEYMQGKWHALFLSFSVNSPGSLGR